MPRELLLGEIDVCIINGSRRALRSLSLMPGRSRFNGSLHCLQILSLGSHQCIVLISILPGKVHSELIVINFVSCLTGLP
jgi:hypothetical protein